jgi:putative hemolysin
MVVAQPMYYLSKITSPFVWLLSKSIELAAKVLRLREGETKVTEEEIKSIIQEGTESGEVQEVEQRIMGRVFSLGDRSVESIMTHRNDIVWLSTNMSAEQVRKRVDENPHSLYPVIEDNPDRLLGVVYLKDLFSQLSCNGFTLRSLVRKAKYFHEQTEVYNALEQLREEHLRYGIVCDEFGVTQGIFTLQDILDALVGDMPAEHEQPNIVRREDGSALVDGQCPFFDFLAHYGLEDAFDHSEYNTISGLILDVLGHIPTEGERLEWNDFQIEIIDMDSVRIDKVLVKKNNNI